MIAPNSDVYLLKCPLELDNRNQLTFSNATAQHNYFNGLPKLELGTNFTYQRKDGIIRANKKFDDILEYNYVMYRNNSYSNKWFYAYIDDMEYVNDNMTAIRISTDVFQTWGFDLNYKSCFVEREHVNDDTIGSHTIPEGLELGEYMINSSNTLKPDTITKDKYDHVINTELLIVFQVTELAGGVGIASSAFNSSYNRVFSGLYYFAVSTYANARDIIHRYDQAGKGDDIIAIFLAPKEFFEGAEVYGDLGYNIYIPQDSGYASTLLEEATITRPTKLNGYTPKNNKLFTFPYSYVYVTNNVGIDSTFKFEDFANATPKFFMIGALGQGCNTKLLPVSYKGYVANAEVFEYGVTGAKYPICAWASDYYTNWVTQNAVNMPLSIAKGVLNAGINSSYNKGTSALNLLTSIGSVMEQRYEAQVHPDQAKGNTSGSDLLPCSERYFTVDCMSVRAEMARTIDEFFSTFGYKVNRVKVPNVTGRTNWNYVKTIGCYIDADIPQNDLQTIKDMFDNGVTFWHNANTFLDYSQSNAIV